MRHQLFIAPLFPIACCLILGIVIGKYFPLDVWLTLGTLAVSIVITLLLYRFPRWQTTGIWISTILFGICLFQHPLPESSYVRHTGERLQDYRQQLLEEYQQQGLDENGYAIIAAMTLGDKSALTRETRQLFNVTGAGHALAISGLHLGIIYMLISLLVVGRRFRFVTQILTLLALWIFAFLVGMTPSVVRSATMLTVYGLLSLGYRQKMSVNVLAFTAIVLLIAQPNALFDIGFQMSFLAVLAILLFFPLLYNIIPLHWLMEHRWVSWLWGMTALSLSAQIGVAPLIAFYFHRFSVYFLFSNFVVIPCAYLILAGALLLLVTHLSFIVIILAGVTKFMMCALATIASLPCASIEELYPSVGQILLMYVVIGCLYFVFVIRKKAITA
jgi:ComEC/Rec2-related protein